jgi:hypothetical protein
MEVIGQIQAPVIITQWLQHQLDRMLGGLHIWYRHNDEEMYV